MASSEVIRKYYENVMKERTSYEKSFFTNPGWRKGQAILYGLGAAIVIIGALFKILHLPGANIALIIGMSVEAIIFAVSAVEPPAPLEWHYEWEKVYPQLLKFDEQVDIEKIEEAEIGLGGGGGGGMGLPSNIKLEEKDVTSLVEAQKKLPAVFESLSKSIDGLKTNVDQLSGIADASLATSDFTAKLKAASGKLEQFNSGFGVSVEAIKTFSNSAGDVKAYSESLKGVTTNLNALSGIYKAELDDTKKHIEAVGQYYGGISKVFQNLLETSKDTDALRQEVAKLTTNMKSLNTVYGNMLTAMRQQ
jgi:gliding motility-associated protein GldL